MGWLNGLLFSALAAWGGSPALQSRRLDTFLGQSVLSFSQKYDYDCAPLTGEIVKKLSGQTQCHKKTWDNEAATFYYECRTGGVMVYITDTAANCIQLKSWLEAAG